MDPVTSFESVLDDNGFLPGDADYTGEGIDPGDGGATNYENFEDHIEEFDEDGNVIEESPDESDEDESDEGGDPDDESDEGEGDGDEGRPEQDPDQLFDIVIGDEEYEVNLAELQSGYLRNEDFINRSQALEQEYAEKLAELEAKELALASELEVAAVLGASGLKEFDNIDWAKLKAEAPEEYAKKRLEFIDRRDEITQQMNRRQSIHQMLAKADEIKQQAYLAEQVKLAETLIPQYKDKEFQAALVAYGSKLGFEESEIRGIVDPRHLVLLDNARKWEESQVRKKEVLQKKPVDKLPEVIKPGSKRPVADADTRRAKAARQHLRENGSVRAAAAAFIDFV
ncbi:putative scaffold protein [Pseudomonas phage BroderSalsa]|nr:putative scaffold protein [Pseudomonas phage BroderSalsa]